MGPDANAVIDGGGARLDAGAVSPDAAVPADAAPGADRSEPPRDTTGGVDSPSSADAGPVSTSCAPLPPPSGPTVTVAPGMAGALASTVSGAAAGTTILLMDGTYPLGGAALRFRTPGVTLRSASNDPSKVVIDGEYRTPEIAVITASNVTIAHVTLTRALDHPVHAYPEGTDVRQTRLYGLRIIDGGEQFVKVNPDGPRAHFVDEGRLECSFLQLTEAGRPMVETLGGTSCYTGGIDVHGGRGWVVRGNRFEDIYCRTGRLAEHAIHLWTGSRDSLIENNVIVNCARGIGLGLVAEGAGRNYPDDPYPGRGYIGHYGGLVRNNVIYANVPAYDTGIELDQARGVRVHHNTVFAGPGATGAFSSIDARFPNTLADIRNNLVNRLTVRDGAVSNAMGNREMVPASWFRDVMSADFHLTAAATEAIDRGVVVPEPGLDIDGQPHTLGGGPDLGADEAR